MQQMGLQKTDRLKSVAATQSSISLSEQGYVPEDFLAAAPGLCLHLLFPSPPQVILFTFSSAQFYLFYFYLAIMSPCLFLAHF